MQPSARWQILLLLALGSGCEHSGLPNTPLFVGIEGAGYWRGTRMLQARLKSHFPTGSSDRQLTAYLQQQGLGVERDDRRSLPITRTATFKYSSLVCGSQVRVSWVANAAHAIQSIDALYADTGCP